MPAFFQMQWAASHLNPHFCKICKNKLGLDFPQILGKIFADSPQNSDYGVCFLSCGDLQNFHHNRSPKKLTRFTDLQTAGVKPIKNTPHSTIRHSSLV